MKLDLDWRRRLESGERLTWRLAAKLLFVGVFAAVILVAASTSSIFVAIIASVVIGLMIRAVLPYDELKQRARSYWTGAAGDRWRRRVHGLGRTVKRLIPRL